MTRKQLRQVAQQALLYLLVILVAIYALFPFYWAFVTSFKTENEMFQTAAYLPRNPTLQNYEYVFSGGSFLLALRNSALVSSAASIFALVAGSFAAYALGRLRFRGRVALLYVVLSMTMFPAISILSGLYTIVRQLGFFGTGLSLLVTYPIFTLPFTVWVLTSFFKGLPPRLSRRRLSMVVRPFRLSASSCCR
jgi:trehalose/maltose transport system permease protein